MNKNFSLGNEQHKRNLQRRAKQYSASSRGSSHGCFIFSYKGILIKKEFGMYSVYKNFKVSGCDAALVEGEWNRASDFKRELDFMLDSANKERLEEVRALHKNFHCPECKGVNYLDPKLITHFESSIGDTIYCNQCGQSTSISILKLLPDNQMY
ncbi:hypothetical protein ACAF60_07890 [Klebsiella aerogenes]|uniref:hypothetical protein n=1 Tax=Klebsiella aerogenes TaxID=548 RepID=UPI000A369B3D|nr:hypothetical protein [Klebsiella aerogenes]EKT8945012.1 hypothetical protein [Klebsiella aerogenes]EKV8595956.1 hypothetical protein [Klebsiella aerogenes]OUE90456.1 hypothetical protein AZZ82_000542 [Klebsiella aerogenes]